MPAYSLLILITPFSSLGYSYYTFKIIAPAKIIGGVFICPIDHHLVQILGTWEFLFFLHIDYYLKEMLFNRLKNIFDI